jgi:hemoglobin
MTIHNAEKRRTSMKNCKTAILTAALTAMSVLAPAVAEPRASLYQRLGGMPAIRAVTDDFVSRVLADERINKWFAHAASDPANAAAYKQKLADFLCQGTGGPCRYEGPDMVAAHRGRGITDEAFNSVVEDLVATLEKLKVPEKEKSDLLVILGPMRMAVVQH